MNLGIILLHLYTKVPPQNTQAQNTQSPKIPKAKIPKVENTQCPKIPKIETIPRKELKASQH